MPLRMIFESVSGFAIRSRANFRIGARFDAKPGMTGPWQVAGRNEVTDFEEVVALETDYMRRWSVWLDARLILKTVPVVFRRRGAL